MYLGSSCRGRCRYGRGRCSTCSGRCRYGSGRCSTCGGRRRYGRRCRYGSGRCRHGRGRCRYGRGRCSSSSGRYSTCSGRGWCRYGSGRYSTCSGGRRRYGRGRCRYGSGRCGSSGRYSSGRCSSSGRYSSGRCSGGRCSGGRRSRGRCRCCRCYESTIALMANVHKILSIGIPVSKQIGVIFRNLKGKFGEPCIFIPVFTLDMTLYIIDQFVNGPEKGGRCIAAPCNHNVRYAFGIIYQFIFPNTPAVQRRIWMDIREAGRYSLIIS
ncbi:hypothetical protein F5X98DRAFT_110243 [Xylaria grammica]|nr:hypothetical protein F5X98DRAFT_110243 [Xylaria grammica]